MNTDDQNRTEPTLPKLWDDLSEGERQDNLFLTRLLQQYQTTLEHETDPESRRVLQDNEKLVGEQATTLRKTLRKQHEKVTKLLAEQESSNEKHGELIEYYEAFLNEHDIYYLASEHVYMQYFPDTGRWESMIPQALHQQYSIRGHDSRSAFDDALDNLQRKKMSVECTFFDAPDRNLNLMRRDHWLQPIEGEAHYAFHLLVKSLGNNKPENMEHIEQVVYWKYSYPEEYRLPCMVIYGEGGVGKNTFVNEVLGTIFGQHQVLVADAEKTIGQFNGLIQGKTVVMIDEALADKVNAERLKSTVGNRTIDINPKYGKQGEHDNTPLYMAGGNDNSGAILLAGNATDRRWSIIKVEKSIIQRLADDKGISFDEALSEYKRIERVYTDRDEVAKWLHYLIARWSILDMPPVGLHQEDYHELLETQKSPFDEIVEIVFGQHDFDYIEGTVLYQLYQDFIRESNPAQRGVIGRNKFYTNVRTWLSRNYPEVVWGSVKVSSTTKMTTAKVFYKNTGKKTFADNRHHYLTVQEDQTPFWVRVHQEEGLHLVTTDGEVESVVDRIRAESAGQLPLGMTGDRTPSKRRKAKKKQDRAPKVEQSTSSAPSQEKGHTEGVSHLGDSDEVLMNVRERHKRDKENSKDPEGSTEDERSPTPLESGG